MSISKLTIVYAFQARAKSVQARRVSPAELFRENFAAPLSGQPTDVAAPVAQIRPLRFPDNLRQPLNRSQFAIGVTKPDLTGGVGVFPIDRAERACSKSEYKGIVRAVVVDDAPVAMSHRL